MADRLEEDATSRARRIEPPAPERPAHRLGSRNPLEVARDHHADVANRAGLHELAHLEEARQRAAVVRDPQRDARVAAGSDHREAVCVVHRHRLLGEHRLAGRRAPQHEVAMRFGHRGDVHDVDVRSADDRLGVVVPTRDAVAPREALGSVGVTVGDGDELRVHGIAKARPALLLGHLAATDQSPANRPHDAVLPTSGAPATHCPAVMDIRFGLHGGPLMGSWTIGRTRRFVHAMITIPCIEECNIAPGPHGMDFRWIGSYGLENLASKACLRVDGPRHMVRMPLAALGTSDSVH